MGIDRWMQRMVRAPDTGDHHGSEEQPTLEKLGISIEPLSKENLQEAISLANSVFPEEVDSEENPELEYLATLEPETYRTEMSSVGIISEKNWVARRNGEVVGVIGLYQKSSDPEGVIWLGWYCVLPQARHQGIGTGMLEEIIAAARNEGYEKIRLWTTSEPHVADAQKLFEKVGFALVREDTYANNPLYKILYREKKL